MGSFAHGKIDLRSLALLARPINKARMSCARPNGAADAQSRCQSICLVPASRRISFTATAGRVPPRAPLLQSCVHIAMPSRRAHTKSRLGCVQCKARRVKVDSHTLVSCDSCSPHSYSATKLTRHVRTALDMRRLVCTARSNLALRRQRQTLRLVKLQIMAQQER